MRFRNVLLAATVLVAPLTIGSAVVMAQPVNGLYVGGGVGYNYLQEQKVRSVSPTFVGLDSSNKLTGKGGFVGLASIGYGLGNGLRFEIEGDYRQTHQRLKGGSFSGGDDNHTYGGFVNALFDFDVGNQGYSLPVVGFGVFPYVGAGVGYEETELKKSRAYLPGTTSGYNFERSDSRGSLAVQGIAGLGFGIGSIPGLTVTTEYRFMSVLDKERFRGTENISALGGPASFKAGTQYNHAGLIGLRYAFNVPTPPTPAGPTAAEPGVLPPNTYLVFFDWDRADLTARARQIITQAADNVTKVQVTRIEVSGHADRSGTPAYNQRLSLRRAQNVAAELVRHGVPQGEIDIQAFGDTKPLVATAAGVREPQNRRVEIVLR